jgi:hypothetical protein
VKRSIILLFEGGLTRHVEEFAVVAANEDWHIYDAGVASGTASPEAVAILEARRELRLLQKIDEALNPDRVTFAARVASDLDEPATF